MNIKGEVEGSLMREVCVLQLLILIVNLPGFRMTQEINLWGVPKGFTRG